MAKWQNDAFLDAAFAYISTNYDELYLCSAQPATYAEASSTYKLAGITGTNGDVTGPANGDTSGRKLTIDAQTGISVTGSGDVTHVAICSSDTLLYVTTCTTQTVTSGNTASTSAWDIEIADVS